jgi:thiosulfate reductase cytochrome b subunit
LGIQFDWVDIHWMTGVALAVLVVIHIVRSLVWQDWRNMMIWLGDLRDIWRGLWRTVVPRIMPAARPGKYDSMQKLYHFATAILILAAVGSGLLMLLKIDTPFWRRNPYWFSADTWGIIYVIHDLAAMAIVSMVMIHLYFVLRPDEWYLTRSMFRGWISRKEYSAHHDSERWKA